jgi:hypothetical protein
LDEKEQDISIFHPNFSSEFFIRIFFRIFSVDLSATDLRMPTTAKMNRRGEQKLARGIRSTPKSGKSTATTTKEVTEIKKPLGCPDCAKQQPPPRPLPQNVGQIRFFTDVAAVCCDKHVLARFHKVAETLGIEQVGGISHFTASYEKWICNHHNVTESDRKALEEWVARLKDRYEDPGSKIVEELALVGIVNMSEHHLNLFVDALLFGTIHGSAHARHVRHVLFGGGNASTAQTLHDDRKLLPDAVNHWRQHLAKPTLSDDTAKACLESVEGGALFAHHPDKPLLIQAFLVRCNK